MKCKLKVRVRKEDGIYKVERSEERFIFRYWHPAFYQRLEKGSSYNSPDGYGPHPEFSDEYKAIAYAKYFYGEYLELLNKKEELRRQNGVIWEYP